MAPQPQRARERGKEEEKQENLGSQHSCLTSKEEVKKKEGKQENWYKAITHHFPWVEQRPASSQAEDVMALFGLEYLFG